MLVDREDADAEALSDLFVGAPVSSDRKARAMTASIALVTSGVLANVIPFLTICPVLQTIPNLLAWKEDLRVGSASNLLDRPGQVPRRRDVGRRKSPVRWSAGRTVQ